MFPCVSWWIVYVFTALYGAYTVIHKEAKSMIQLENAIAIHLLSGDNFHLLDVILKEILFLLLIFVEVEHFTILNLYFYNLSN